MKPAQNEISRFVQRFRWALKSLPKEEREDLVREIEGHLKERQAENPDWDAAALVKDFGQPEDYARRFLQDYLISSALVSNSGLRMMTQALRLFHKGVFAFTGSLIFLGLYTLALSILSLVVLKFLFPDRVGFWFSRDPPLLYYGFVNEQVAQKALDLLGFWIVPVSLILAVGIYQVTTLLLKKFLQSMRDRIPS